MSEQIRDINFYPGFEPRQSNWDDWQLARIQAENSKWSVTKQPGVLPNSGLFGAAPFVFSVNMATGTFTVSAGVAFDAVGDRIEIQPGVVPGGDGTLYNALNPTLQDNQNPPQSLAASPGSKDIPLQKDVLNALVDTYVFIQTLDTIDQSATNRFLPNRPWQYPKHDLGYNFRFYTDAASASAAMGLTDAVFIGAVRILNGGYSVIKEFTLGQPPALVQTFQVPYLLGNDERDVVGGDDHAHEGPYLRGNLYVESPNTLLRIRLVEDAVPTNYVDFLLSDGLINSAVITNSAKYTVAGTGFSSGQEVEFSVPAGSFPFQNPAVRKLRVQLSSTGYFIFPDTAAGSTGTPSSRAGLSTTQLQELHRVFWANLRIETSKDQPSNPETVFLSNNSFEMPATSGGLSSGTVGTVDLGTGAPTTGAVDCSIPGWSNPAQLNFMALLQTSVIAPPPSFPSAGLFLLCTYSTAAADAVSTATGLSSAPTAAGGFGTSTLDTKYVLVTLPESGNPEFAIEQASSTKDYDNRHVQPAIPALSGGGLGVQNPSLVMVTDLLPVGSLGSLSSRGWAAIGSATRNKWGTLSGHFQRIWSRLLEHDHSGNSGCQQVVTDGIADSAVTLIKLAPALTTPVLGVAGLVPGNLCCISLTGVCPTGWAPVGVPGAFLLLSPGTLPVQLPSATNTPGVAAVTNILTPNQLLKDTTVGAISHSHFISAGAGAPPFPAPPPLNLSRSNNSDLVNTNGLKNVNFAKEDHSHTGNTALSGSFSSVHTHGIPVYTVTLCQK